MKVLSFFSLICFLFSFTCCVPDLPTPDLSSGKANFSKTIAVGGNYLSGYQDGALYRKGQQNSIPALLAKQFRLLGGDFFNQQLMPDNNGLGLNPKYWESYFVSPSRLGYKADCKGVTSLTPIKKTISEAEASPYLVSIAGNSIQNLAIPFVSIYDYFNPAFGNSFSTGNKNPFYNRVASNPGISTLFEDIMAQNATFVTAWLGMEDVYNYASSGGTGAPIPSPAYFSNYLDLMLNGLVKNGAKGGVIATIPDFRVFPYYSLISWDNAELNQTQADSINALYDSTIYTHIHFHSGRNGFVMNDLTLPEGARQMRKGEYITLSVPIDSMKCNKYGIVITPINNRYALDSTEVNAIDNAILNYNAVIRQKAIQHNFALADMYTFFNTVKSGIKWNGVDYNAEFVSGGFFSLDGYHPNQKGYALIANEFIKAINATYNSTVPPVNCEDCDGVLFP